MPIVIGLIFGALVVRALRPRACIGCGRTRRRCQCVAFQHLLN